MLALSASDLADLEPNPVISKELSCKAMGHRVSAISALNNAISEGLRNYEEANAMLATCFSLLFQSVMIEDGLAEYMSFIRGTVTVGIQMGINKYPVLFKTLFEGNGEAAVDPAMLAAPLISPTLVRGALGSLERICPLCKHPVELEIYGMLLATARALITSSRDAWMCLKKIYGLFSYLMPQASFTYYIDPRNRVCQILQAHFVALQLIMTPVTRNEKVVSDQKKNLRVNDGTTAKWFRPLHKDVPVEWSRYYEWTMWVERECSEGRVYNGIVKVEDEDEASFCENGWPQSRSVEVDDAS
ncbi:hypothetical protein BJ875DRAFT_211741 [Amylocarpus encephaloides]|uniref:Uncharacterized protein n=1 Tax=Amylocarpus encephaloides TaxID=45428 RepID=A0A9P8C0D0_9HELO|nr:hypothetical protein BJ875DRAFT_211741 [Amylocarpus encephaloides]